jgi:2-polyprenyl-3-methyl-5-hydroxy-6-metoxy-1,4-benzoquinol methylase
MKSKKLTIEFYDHFNITQIGKRINHRHILIQQRLENYGLKRNHKLLEVGSGAGGPTELILRYLSSQGQVLVTDISPERIELARKRLKKYSNAKFEVIDFTNVYLNESFDVIILPDVLEHIPLDLHNKLFLNLKLMLKGDGFIFINIPDPNYLQWLVDEKSKLLQIIDQPIHLHILSNNLVTSGLYIHFLESYSVYINGHDYQTIVIKKRPEDSTFKSKFPDAVPFAKKLRKKIRYILRGNK